MAINIYKDKMTSAQLFGKEVLYTKSAISRSEVPEGWYCYDLCGTDRKPDKDITRITYGRNTIYEAAPVQTERPAQDIGGMRLG